jgi:hypothetical protein
MHMKTRFRSLTNVTVALAALLMAAPQAWAAKCTKAEKCDATVAVEWFDLLYDLVKQESISPPPASRIYAISAVTLYESVTPGHKTRRSLAGQLNDLTIPLPAKRKKLHLPLVANSAIGTVALGLFADKPGAMTAIQAKIDELDGTLGEKVNKKLAEQSIARGEEIGAAILAWAGGDGFSTNNNCPYTVPVGPGLWEPTPPAFAAAPLQPCWGENRPMVLTDVAFECVAPGAPTYDESNLSYYYMLALEVYAVGNLANPELQDIARFWADGPGTGTPPGHWVDFVRQATLNEDLSLIDSAEAFARAGIAVHDAFIACWAAKYAENLQRPITFINDFIDPEGDWASLIGTPPFPEYTSGHSTQSGAVSVALEDFFGGSYAFTDTLIVDQGLTIPGLTTTTRGFHSIDQAAREAVDSRLYGGIHFRTGNEDGYEQGRCIGQAIVDRVQFRTK